MFYYLISHIQPHIFRILNRIIIHVHFINALYLCLNDVNLNDNDDSLCLNDVNFFMFK